MNQYTIIPEDTIRILPPEDGAEAAIEIFCSRTVIYFEIAALRSVCLTHGVPYGSGKGDALAFEADDRLLGTRQLVYVPVSRPDYALFLADLRRYAPDTLDFSQEADYLPPSCRHDGRGPA